MPQVALVGKCVCKRESVGAQEICIASNTMNKYMRTYQPVAFLDVEVDDPALPLLGMPNMVRVWQPQYL